MDIAVRVKQIMSLLHMKPEEVAAKGAISADSIRTILKGNSKNPGAELLKGMAKAFDCTIDMIVSDEEISLESLKKHKEIPFRQELTLDMDLYRDAIFAVEDAARDKGLDLRSNAKLRKFYVDQLYKMAIERAGATGKNPEIDPFFAGWLVGKDIKESF